MARIRTIKPEFPQSETVGRLSRDARLLFIQLWTIADDSGRARAASRMLASLLFPYDDDAPSLIEGWLAELDHHGHVRRYEVDGVHYLDIPKWLEHQKIDRPTPSRLPELSRKIASPRELSPPDLGPRTRNRTKELSSSLRSDDSGSQLGERPDPPPSAAERSQARATRLPADWVLPKDWGDFALGKGLTRDQALAESEKFREHWLAKPKNNTSLDWRLNWQTWIRKAIEYGAGSKINGARAHQRTQDSDRAAIVEGLGLAPGVASPRTAAGACDHRGAPEIDLGLAPTHRAGQP